MPKAKTTASPQTSGLLDTLQARFESNMDRHPGVKWETVQSKLEGNAKALKSLAAMEESGGEPDVVTLDRRGIAFIDCAAQSPKGRRSVCYDKAALDARKEHKPKDSAMEMAARWGVELLTEDEYRHLQTLGEFDTTTSSWIQTPAKIRKLGGALLCDRRFDTVFTYHNGAESYYAARGFRCIVRL